MHVTVLNYGRGASFFSNAAPGGALREQRVSMRWSHVAIPFSFGITCSLGAFLIVVLLTVKQRALVRKVYTQFNPCWPLRDERTSDKTVRLAMVKSCTKLLSLPTPICFGPNKVTMNEPLTDVLSQSVMLIATPFWHILQSVGCC